MTLAITHISIPDIIIFMRTPNYLIIYTHTDIHHYLIFALNYAHFHSIHIYTCTIHAELESLVSFTLDIKLNTFPHIFYFIWNTYLSICIISSITTSTTFIDTDSKWIKKFVRVFINKCWSSLPWFVIWGYTFFASFRVKD